MNSKSMAGWIGFAGVLMVLAGAFEGTVLGILQWPALTRAFKALPARDWISATIAIAATGWLVGMLPSTLMQPTAAGSNSVWEPPGSCLPRCSSRVRGRRGCSIRIRAMARASPSRMRCAALDRGERNRMDGRDALELSCRQSW